ncbi:protein phosphatase 2c domain-containing protein, partial [Cystoisospora suis]
TTSGTCTSLNLRWSTCSMQGWRVSMEDAHLVLYAKTFPRVSPLPSSPQSPSSSSS